MKGKVGVYLSIIDFDESSCCSSVPLCKLFNITFMRRCVQEGLCHYKDGNIYISRSTSLILETVDDTSQRQLEALWSISGFGNVEKSFQLISPVVVQNNVAPGRMV